MEIALGLLFIAAVFLAWKVYEVLGTQQGHVPNFQSGPDAAGADQADDTENALAEQSIEPANFDALIAEGVDKDIVKTGLSEIAATDGHFVPHKFIGGATSAFDMIMSAFANNDRDTLSSLVSKEIFEAFDQAIKQREATGQSLRFMILAEPTVQYLAAEVDRGMAYVTLKIESVQSSSILDAEDNPIDEAQGQSQNVVNNWVFSRQVPAKDPNWTLIQTAA